MSTHTLEVAETMCDRIAIIHGGKIVAHGTMAELREQTASGDASLEDLFLKLTGGLQDHQLDTILDSLICDGPVSRPELWTVLTPKWRSALARLREEQSWSRGPRLILLGLVALVFWSGVFGIAYRVLRYFRGVDEIGDLLAAKLLGIILLAFLSILLLSNIITALSSFFLAKDLDLLVAAPVSSIRLYSAKLVETMVHSSWMVALLALPIFTAYGIVYDGGPSVPVVVLGGLRALSAASRLWWVPRLPCCW